jgi:hypothetical protein
VRDKYTSKLAEEIGRCRQESAKAVEDRVAEGAAEGVTARDAALEKARGEGATKLSQQVNFGQTIEFWGLCVAWENSEIGTKPRSMLGAEGVNSGLNSKPSSLTDRRGEGEA